MTFDEWFHKEYEPADLQIKQYAERNEGLHIPAKVYLEDLKKAFEAGLHTDVHTDNSKVIAELEAQIEKMKCCGNCAFQLVIGGVRDSHCVKCNAYSEWELAD